MENLTEDPPAVAAPSAPVEKQPRRWGLILAVAAIVGVIVVTGTVHLLGPHGALIAGGIAAAVVALAAVVWRLPHLRRHFAGPRGRSRSRSWRPFAGGRRTGSTSGSRRRSGGLPKLGRRRPGSGGQRRGLGRALGRGRGGSQGSARRSLFGRGRAGQGGAKRGLFGRSRAGSAGGKGSTGRRLFSRSRGGSGSRPGGTRSGRAGSRLRHPFRRAGGGGKMGGGKASPAGRFRRGAKAAGGGVGKTTRKAWNGTAGRMFPRLKRGGKTGSSPPPGGRSRRSPAAAVRSAGRGIRSGWQRARNLTGGKTGKTGLPKPPARKVAEVAGAAMLLPLIGAVAGAKRLWAWWRNRKKTSAPDDMPATTADAEPEPAEPDPQADRPPTSPEPAPAQGEKTMSHIQAASEAVQQHIGGYSPESMLDLNRHLEELPGFFEATGEALSRFAETLSSDHPVHQAPTDVLRDLATAVHGMGEFAAEAFGAWRQAHADDLERLENPRTGEQEWDVSNQ